MLGAVRSQARVDSVSTPPRGRELSDAGKGEWTLGYELLETCVDTYDSPTYVHSRKLKQVAIADACSVTAASRQKLPTSMLATMDGIGMRTEGRIGM